MKYDEVIRKLQGKLYATVYFLYGEEAYYIDKVCNWIEANVVDAAAQAFDQTVIYGKDLPQADVSPVVSAARGFPMMGEKKLIIVKEAQNIKKWDALTLYMDNPQPSTMLVFCYKHGSPDNRLSLFKNLENKGGVMMPSDKLRDYQLTGWVNTYLKERLKQLQTPVTIDPRVPQLLADSIGTDLNAIAGAIDKLLAGMPPESKEINFAMVERNIGISKDYNVFELQDALIKGDVLKANRITRYFADSKDHPMIKELGILFTFFANLMIYHYLPDKTDRIAAPLLGVSPFFVKDYAAAAKRYSAGKTFRIIGYFRDTDARLKGINNPSVRDGELWKELVYKILH